MKHSVGGYFELELNFGREYHKDAFKLNTGRNCLEYILKASNYKKVYLPYYCCEVLLEPIHKLNLDYEYYNIDSELKPVFSKRLKKDEVLIYINYFGIKQNQVIDISEKFENLIIDNTQAFYCKPLPDIDTFYSVRKFFGVPDGAYLYTNKKLIWNLEKDISWNRMEHLLIRIDDCAEEGYKYFIDNEKYLINQPIKTMSNLTLAVLKNINYEKVKKRRDDNFSFVHENLKLINELSIEDSEFNSPLVYPLLVNDGKIKENLIKNKIYVPTYWKSVLNNVKKNSFEEYLVYNLIALPIDQRYDKEDMIRIIKLVNDKEN